MGWRVEQVQTRDKQHWNFSINTGIFRRGGRPIRKIPFAIHTGMHTVVCTSIYEETPVTHLNGISAVLIAFRIKHHRFSRVIAIFGS